MSTKTKSTKSKSEKPTTTKPRKDVLLAQKIDELLKKRRQFGHAVLDWEVAHSHAGELKKFMEKLQDELNGLVQDIDDIKSGNYNPPLPFKGSMPSSAQNNGRAANGKAAAPGVDEGAKLPLSALAEFGLSHGKIELLKGAIDGPTIGDLERWQRTHPNYWRDIKGFGETGHDKLTDAMSALRKKHPHVDPVLTKSEQDAKAAKPETPPAPAGDDREKLEKEAKADK